MVTKQQQLEWLAINYDEWPFSDAWVIMCPRSPMGFASRPGILITKKEWQQERDKMSSKPEIDNSWHERGELPPIGCECEWVDESGVDGPAGSLYPCVGDTVSVCAHRQTPGGNVIAIFTWSPGDDGLRVAASRMPEDFRPLRTEREKAIDAARAAVCKAGPYDHERDLIGKLYDAGMLK